MSAGVANLPADAVMVMSPAAARLVVRGLELLDDHMKQRGTRIPGQIEAVAQPFRNLAEFRTEPTVSRGDGESVASSGSESGIWLSASETASRLMVSQEYTRRLARHRLAPVGLARKTDDNGWMIAEEGVMMIENQRGAA